MQMECFLKELFGSGGDDFQVNYFGGGGTVQQPVSVAGDHGSGEEVQRLVELAVLYTSAVSGPVRLEEEMQTHPLPLLPADVSSIQSSTAPVSRQTKCSPSAATVESLNPETSHPNRDHGKDRVNL